MVSLEYYQISIEHGETWYIMHIEKFYCGNLAGLFYTLERRTWKQQFMVVASVSLIISLALCTYNLTYLT